MSDNDLSSADPLGAIADEFVEAFRQGKRPSVEEFAQRYPEHADEIRDLLPALALMEKAKSADDPRQGRPARAPAKVSSDIPSGSGITAASVMAGVPPMKMFTRNDFPWRTAAAW